jgi:large subunit ribosomal protein L21
MKKAIIVTGGVQHLVAEGDVLLVNYLGDDNKKTIDFTPIMIVDGKNSIVDAKKLEVSKVTAEVVEESLRGDKVIALRYKAKKRVNVKRGHRQTLTKIKISSVA